MYPREVVFIRHWCFKDSSSGLCLIHVSLLPDWNFLVCCPMGVFCNSKYPWNYPGTIKVNSQKLFSLGGNSSSTLLCGTVIWFAPGMNRDSNKQQINLRIVEYSELGGGHNNHQVKLFREWAILATKWRQVEVRMLSPHLFSHFFLCQVLDVEPKPWTTQVLNTESLQASFPFLCQLPGFNRDKYLKFSGLSTE